MIDIGGQLSAGGLGERYPEVMTRRLVTLAYPVLADANKAAIDSFRAEHDAYHVGVVEAHFTIVFEAEGLDEHDYLNHVGTIAGTASPINFHCRYAMLGADDGEDRAYVFLVPDEGNSAISLLHDRLYTGVLISKMRLDLKYIPHITIGRCSNRLDAKALCDSKRAVSLTSSARQIYLSERTRRAGGRLFRVGPFPDSGGAAIVIETSYQRRFAPATSRRGGTLANRPARSLLDVEMPQIRRGLILLDRHQVTVSAEHILLLADHFDWRAWSAS